MDPTPYDLSAILEETERLNQFIIQSEEARMYRQSKQRLLEDEEAQNLIRRFVQKKEEFEEVARFGRFHPDYHRVREEMFRIKRTMDSHPAVARFKKAEKDLESILHEVSKIIAHAVSDSIKVPSQSPLSGGIGCGGCGGGCASCGNRS